MNKAELIAAAAEKTGRSKKDTEATITAALDVKTATFRTPGNAPFAMYKSLGVKKPPAYFGFAFD